MTDVCSDKSSHILGSGSRTQRSDCPGEVVLGQLKACVHTNSIAQLVTQDTLFAVVGQFEQVEAS